MSRVALTSLAVAVVGVDAVDYKFARAQNQYLPVIAQSDIDAALAALASLGFHPGEYNR
jgi:hypothetical protein